MLPREGSSIVPLTSEISEYDPEWPSRFAEEQKQLQPIFGSKLLRIEHVGSTAVPKLSAKPEIDILVELSDDVDIDGYVPSLTGLGYRRGGDLSEGHHFFKKDFGGLRTHKLHVLVNGHRQVTRMLLFRDHLQNNPKIRQAYQSLKLKLEKENTRGIGEYLRAKAPFIDKVLEEIGQAQRGVFSAETPVFPYPANDCIDATAIARPKPVCWQSRASLLRDTGAPARTPRAPRGRRQRAQSRSCSPPPETASRQEAPR